TCSRNSTGVNDLSPVLTLVTIDQSSGRSITVRSLPDLTQSRSTSVRGLTSPTKIRPLVTSTVTRSAADAAAGSAASANRNSAAKSGRACGELGMLQQSCKTGADVCLLDSSGALRQIRREIR